MQLAWAAQKVGGWALSPDSGPRVQAGRATQSASLRETPDSHRGLGVPPGHSRAGVLAPGSGARRWDLGGHWLPSGTGALTKDLTELPRPPPATGGHREGQPPAAQRMVAPDPGRAGALSLDF